MAGYDKKKNKKKEEQMRLIAQNPLVLHFAVKWGEREIERNRTSGFQLIKYK
jgi:hypothetical protein